MPIQTPLINGNRYDFSSIELSVLGKRSIGIKSVNYNDSLEPGDVYGASAQQIGRTRGKYKAEADIEMYREDWDDLLTALALLPTTSVGGGGGSNLPTPPAGFMEVSFDAFVSFSEMGASLVQTDSLLGCRIKKVDNSNGQGTDALTVKLSLSVLKIKHNGKDPLNSPLGAT